MKSCSLTIVCVIIFVVILFMIFSGSKNNMYGLIEGMEAKKDEKQDEKQDEKKKSNPISEAAKPLKNLIPVIKTTSSEDSSKSKSETETETEKKESFQVRKPAEYADIEESRSDTWNLSKWVKDALRFSKGMGSVDKLDSYKYHTGPKIPLPEGQLFFFNNTKFDTECCPSTYTSSRGCACLSLPQYNYLMMRGGNNTPPKNTNTAYFNEY